MGYCAINSLLIMLCDLADEKLRFLFETGQVTLELNKKMTNGVIRLSHLLMEGMKLSQKRYYDGSFDESRGSLKHRLRQLDEVFTSESETLFTVLKRVQDGLAEKDDDAALSLLRCLSVSFSTLI